MVIEKVSENIGQYCRVRRLHFQFRRVLVEVFRGHGSFGLFRGSRPFRYNDWSAVMEQVFRVFQNSCISVFHRPQFNVFCIRGVMLICAVKD